MKLGSTCPANDELVSKAAAGEMCLEEENQGGVSTTETMSPKISGVDIGDKKGGGGGHGGGGKGGGAGGEAGRGAGGAGVQGAGNRGATGEAGRAFAVPKPMKLLGLPFVLARHVKAAILPIVNTTSEAAGMLKLTGANEAMIMGQNKTSVAPSMPRPSRLFGLAFALAEQIRAATLLTKNRTTRPSGEVKFMGGNVYYLENANHTSDAAGRPRFARIFRLPLVLAGYMKATVLADAHEPNHVRNATAMVDPNCEISAPMADEDHSFRFRGGGGTGSAASSFWSSRAFRVLVLLVRNIDAVFLPRSPASASRAAASTSSDEGRHHTDSVAVSSLPTGEGQAVPILSAEWSTSSSMQTMTVSRSA
ncbi:hypothetical protein CLAIMM_03829 [Cladophialophora immunda]|nr:hypothetical protein CLAIMM_03829 [Cladophialophora immunda]